MVHQIGAAIDVFSYGDFYNLSAGNAYLGDRLIDWFGQGCSLKAVQVLLRRKCACGVCVRRMY